MAQGMTLIREVAVSYKGPRRRLASPLRAPADVADFVRRVVAHDAREHFVALYLDGRHRPISYQIVSVGTATASLVHPREIFQPAVAVGAVALIIAHNHPSGDPKPSAEDHTVTSRLAKAGELLGLRLIDHVIVGGDALVSLQQESPALFEIAPS